LAVARATARAATARVSGARRPPDPQFQLGIMNRQLPSLAPMEVLGMTQLQVMQMVPLAGKLGLAGDAAAAQASAARERAEDVSWQLRSDVAMAFYDLYAADRSIEVATVSRRLLQDIAKTAQTMYAVGDGRQADVLKAQVEIARMTEDVVRMRTMRTAMVSRIGGLLNRAIDSMLASPELPPFPTELPSLDSLQRWAELNRPMIRAGREDVRAADASLRFARRDIWPDLQIGVQYAQQGGAMGEQRMASLMIGATLPVFAKSRQLEMREEAEAMKAMAIADLAAMRAETRARVAELYANLLRSRNLTTLYQSTILPQARASVASSLAAYRVGQVNLMTLLDNHMTVNRYEQDLFTLQAEEGKALAELEMLIGRELVDSNASQRAMMTRSNAVGSAR
jgi:outer membrane protein TolC